MNLNVLDPLTHALDIAEKLLDEGREDDALKVLGRVNDAIEERCVALIARKHSDSTRTPIFRSASQIRPC